MMYRSICLSSQLANKPELLVLQRELCTLCGTVNTYNTDVLFLLHLHLHYLFVFIGYRSVMITSLRKVTRV